MLCQVIAQVNHEFHLFTNLIYYDLQNLLPALEHLALPQSLKHFWQEDENKNKIA